MAKMSVKTKMEVVIWKATQKNVCNPRNLANPFEFVSDCLLATIKFLTEVGNIVEGLALTVASKN